MTETQSTHEVAPQISTEASNVSPDSMWWRDNTMPPNTSHDSSNWDGDAMPANPPQDSNNWNGNAMPANPPQDPNSWNGNAMPANPPQDPNSWNGNAMPANPPQDPNSWNGNAMPANPPQESNGTSNGWSDSKAKWEEDWKKPAENSWERKEWKNWDNSGGDSWNKKSWDDWGNKGGNDWDDKKGNTWDNKGGKNWDNNDNSWDKGNSWEKNNSWDNKQNSWDRSNGGGWNDWNDRGNSWSNGNSGWGGGSSWNRSGGDGGWSGGGKWGGGGGGYNSKGGDEDFQLDEVDYNKVKVKKFIRDFYKENPAVTNRSWEETKRIEEEMSITVARPTSWPRDRMYPKLVTSFQESGLEKFLIDALENRFPNGQPTKIQMQGWPIALSGLDMVGVAETGSGKTLAYLLPGVTHMLAQDPVVEGDGPICLVLVPTRELAQQIKEESDKFKEHVEAVYNTGCVFGGVKKWEQLRYELRDPPPDVLVATPGRLIDFLRDGSTNLKRVTYLVLDEADRMLDMGFKDQLRSICSTIRPDRQTLMWSATWPRQVRDIAAETCGSDAVRIAIGGAESDDTLRACHKIKQNIRVVHSTRDKERAWKDLIYDLFYTVGTDKLLIFCNTKRKVDDVTRYLRLNGWDAVCIHSDKPQHERSDVFWDFKAGRSTVLVATGVLARGIDVPDVKIVINIDFPNVIDDYVHRIGRTGRAGNEGTAYSFFTYEDAKFAKDLIGILNEANQDVPEELKKLNSYGGSVFGSRSRR